MSCYKKSHINNKTRIIPHECMRIMAGEKKDKKLTTN